MATNPSDKKSSTEPESPAQSAIKDSAQQIWQAGLGAFTRAQVEGSKAFEALVKEGISIQRKTQTAAEAKMVEAAGKMSSLASDITSKATGQWDKLENIFEDRVSKALGKLGVPTAKEVNELLARIDELSEAVRALTEKTAAAKKSAPRKSATPSVAAKAKTTRAAAKKAPTRKAASPKPPKA